MEHGNFVSIWYTIYLFFVSDRTGFSLGNSVTDGQGKIWLDSIHCNGSESNITSCPHQSWGSHDCVHSEDVGVHCFSSYRLNYQYGK